MLIATTSVASAHPISYDHVILVDSNPPPNLIVAPPPPPPPAEKLHTRLGWRVGMGKLPFGQLEVSTIELLQLTGDIQLTDRTRTFAEYELMLLTPDGPPMMKSVGGIGHRGSVGLVREILGRRTRDGAAAFDLSGELGGGATLVSGTIGDRVLPHGLAGLRCGFSLHPEHDTKREPSFGFELLVRATFVPDGVGFGFGLGMYWGE